MNRASTMKKKIFAGLCEFLLLALIAAELVSGKLKNVLTKGEVK